MDLIPFEKVSLQEAKATLDSVAAPRVQRDWAAFRKKSADSKNNELTEQAWQWLNQLPLELQPGGLLQQFPRITNDIAELWKRPLYCEKYFDALIMDQRGSRKGFPPGLTKEIACLKVHYITKVMVQHFGAWGERIGF